MKNSTGNRTDSPVEKTLIEYYILDNPLVSVLMTCYNREKYIAQAIESVLNSTYTNIEVIISDDQSTDGSVAIIKKYAALDSRIKYFINEINLGDYPNRNKAASYASGKYIKYLDSDDFLYPYGLSMLVNRMEANPEAVIGLAKRSLKDRPFPVLLAPEMSYKKYFLDGIGIFDNAPTSTIINRDFFFKAGCFSGLNQYGDFEFWLKAGALAPLLLVEGDVTWDRDHPLSEKYRDSIYYKFRLHYLLSLKALESPANPLSPEQKIIAVKNLKGKYSKFMMRTLLKGKVFKFLELLRTMRTNEI